MKDWEKLTQQELADLTEEKAEFYKKLLCAEAGVKIMAKPNEPEELKEPCDMTVYVIKGISSGWGDEKCVFADMADAQKMVELLKSSRSLGRTVSNSETGWNNKKFIPGLKEEYRESPFTITPVEVYSEEKYMELKSRMSLYTKLKEQYDKDFKEYQENIKKEEAATSDFIEAYTNAKAIMSRRKSLAEKFVNDYLPIADGSRDIAMAFMKKAYSISEDDEKFIIASAEKKEAAV